MYINSLSAAVWPISEQVVLNWDERRGTSEGDEEDPKDDLF